MLRRLGSLRGFSRGISGQGRKQNAVASNTHVGSYSSLEQGQSLINALNEIPPRINDLTKQSNLEEKNKMYS